MEEGREAIQSLGWRTDRCETRIVKGGLKPVLANRKDLSLHFIFSAAIKLLSEQGISVAVGEFKELMDKNTLHDVWLLDSYLRVCLGFQLNF